MSNTSGTLTSFTAGDLVVSISGNGGNTGTYGDNGATPITLEEITPTGTIVGYMILPQTTTVVNGVTEYAISGEYGSSSEGSLALSANGQSLVIMGYGVTATAFNTGGAAVYGTTALAQSTSILGGTYTAVPRIVADIGYNGTVDTSTALYGIYNTNNPRSVATINGTTFYVSGQGVSGDTTQGVFVAQDGASSATSIFGGSDTRAVEIVNGQLYISIDSKQVGGGEIASFGTLLPVSATTAQVLPGISHSVTLTAATANGVNNAAIGSTVNLSPENYFFATPTVLYVADGGNPKEGGLGDGGLQKWSFNGSAWVLDYTLSAGLNLVPDTAAAGTSGLIGLTGTVIGGNVYLYATNETIGDLDQTYLYGITDTLSATVLPTNESFTALVTAAADSNIRGISFAPSAATATTPTVTSVTSSSPLSGFTVTSGSVLDVLSGGTVTSTTVLSGGQATIVAGGLDIGGYIAQGGTETVLGSATGDQVAGLQYLPTANGAVSNEIVLNGGTVDLAIKGTAGSNLTVEEGGSVDINGSITLTTALISGGVIDLQSAKATLAGTITFQNGGTLLVTGNTSAGSGDLAVLSGFGAGDVVDIASGTSIASAGTAAVLTVTSSGGNTVATVSGGGVSDSFIFGGNLTSLLALTSDGAGGEEIVYSAPPPSSTTISSSASGVLVTSGSTLNVLSGGTAVAADVLSGGTLSVQVGGIDQGSTIAAGGLELLSGTATGDAVYGVQLLNSAATATASNETVYNGGSVDLFLAGVIGTGITVDSGGELNISGRGTAVATVLSGGTVTLDSPKATLSGTLLFATTGTLQETATVSAVSSGIAFGDQAVISGFGAGDVIDLTSATAAGSAGSAATLTYTTSAGETFATVSGGGSAETFIFAGTVVGGSLGLVSDGAGGEEVVFGSAMSSSSSSGGSSNSGTTETGVVVSGGAVQTVSAGVTLVAASILSGGSAVINSGAFDQGSTIAAGGNETVLGSASGDVIFGTQLVSAGSALVSNETIGNGGTAELFLAGVTATALTALAGGSIAINGHAVAINTILNGGTLLLESPKATASGTLTFSGAATLDVTAVSSAGYGDQAVISGFAAGDVIDISSATSVGSAATLSSTTSGGDTLVTVSGGGVTESFVFGGTTIAPFLVLGGDGAGGEQISYLACYVRGTLIQLQDREVAIEDLVAGDPVVTVSGALRPVKWIGRRRIDCSRHPSPAVVWPVRILAGAFGGDLPRRDLLVSPQHAIYAEGVLVPAKRLVNGVNVVQDAVNSVEYFHIELDRHDVVLAEGLPAETYLDVGDRAMFENGGDVVTLFPDLTNRDWSSLVWEAEGYAPLKLVGPEVEAIRSRLAGKPVRRTRRKAG